MIPDPLDPGLAHMLPAFRRARDYRLYDGSGRRYLDLWQLDGHAILGHRPPGISRLMKDTLARGLVGDLPSVRSRRLDRALRSLLPDHGHVRVYATLPVCLSALSVWSGSPLGVRDLGDPATGEPPSGAVRLWRPFVEVSTVGAEALVPVLPFSMLGGPWAACFRSDPGSSLALAPPVSPVALEAAAAAVWALARHDRGDLGETLRHEPPRAWHVRGVYVSPRSGSEGYAELYQKFLERGVVLSPHPACPSVLPAQMSPGERAALVALLRAVALE